MLDIHVYGAARQDVDAVGHILAGGLRRAGYGVRSSVPPDGDERAGIALQVEGNGLAEPGTPSQCVAIVLDAPTLATSLDPLPSLALVDAPSAPCHRLRGVTYIMAVDATSIAERHGPGAPAFVALLGAFAGVSHLLPLEALVAAVEEHSADPEASRAACADAYAQTAAALA